MKTILHMIIIQCDPDVIMLGWCYSLNGDVSMVLRSEGVFSQMILNNDLRIITSNPLARLNDTQRQIIKETGLDVILLQSHRYLSLSVLPGKIQVLTF